jgi:hypothetical protein
VTRARRVRIRPCRANCRAWACLLVPSAAAIRLSLQPSPSTDTSAFSRMRAFVISWAERLPLRINSSSWARSPTLNRTMYFLTAISFPTTNHLHRCLAATEIQRLPSFSMTGATSRSRENRRGPKLPYRPPAPTTAPVPTAVWEIAPNRHCSGRYNDSPFPYGAPTRCPEYMSS